MPSVCFSLGGGGGGGVGREGVWARAPALDLGPSDPGTRGGGGGGAPHTLGIARGRGGERGGAANALEPVLFVICCSRVVEAHPGQGCRLRLVGYQSHLHLNVVQASLSTPAGPT